MPEQYAEPKLATTWKALNGRRYLTRNNAYKAAALITTMVSFAL